MAPQRRLLIDKSSKGNLCHSSVGLFPPELLRQDANHQDHRKKGLEVITLERRFCE